MLTFLSARWNNVEGFYLVKYPGMMHIKDAERLIEVEKEITSIRLAELKDNPIAGRFNLGHLKQIHRFIFQDLYKWAGKLRTSIWRLW
jgi:fido (protein-threonine AMPylation protein)